MLAVARQLLLQKRSIIGECWAYTKGPTFLAIVGTLVTIALLALLLRVYVRARIVRSWAVDDWFALAATVCACVVLVFLSISARFDAMQAFGNSPAPTSLLLFWIVTIFDALGIAFMKLSVAFSLLSLAKQSAVRRALYVLVGFIMTCAIAWLLGFVLQCSPVSNAWSLLEAWETRCIHSVGLHILQFALAVIPALENTLLMTIVLIIVLRVRVGIHTRISFTVIFGLGLAACAAAIVRPSTGSYAFGYAGSRPSYRGQCFVLWNVVELNAGLLAANLATLKPLLDHFCNRPDSFTRAQNDLPIFKPLSRRAASSSLRLFLYPRPSIDHHTPTRPPEAHSRTHTLSRYHDPASNVTFDIVETSPRYSRATTRRHTRTTSGMSGWTSFSQTPIGAVELERSSPNDRASGAVSLREGVGARSRGASVGTVLAEVDSDSKSGL